ncbi:MAG: hypothetical protein EBW05_13825 [Betaproteobacteria bacterium]|nr:hypothetical protein [Betaproteobacteria bacterium]
MRKPPEELDQWPAPIRYSIPHWLYERLRAQGADDRLFEALLEPASLDLRVVSWHPKLPVLSREALIDELRKDAILAHASARRANAVSNSESEQAIDRAPPGAFAFRPRFFQSGLLWRSI